MGKSLKTNAVLNAIRQSLSVIFPLLTFPYVSRVLGKTEYGRYTFSASIVSYFSLFAAYGIGNYAVREGARVRNEKKRIHDLASDLFSFNIWTMIISYMMLICLLIFNSKLCDYTALIIIQSLSILFTTIGLDWVNTVYEDYLYITIRYMIIQIVALLLIFAFVKDSKDTAQYCFILVLGLYGGNLLNLIYIRKYIRPRFRYRIKISQYMAPLSILFVNSLATVIYVNSDITMLGFFKTDDAVGIYGFSSKIYNIVKQLINALVIVTIPRLAYINERSIEKYRLYLDKIFQLVVMCVFPAAVGLCMISKWVVYLAGGTEYMEGVDSLRILTCSLIFALIASVFTNCILIVNRLEKMCLISTITSAAVNVGLNLFLIPLFGAEGAAVTTVIAELLNLSLQIIFTKKKLGLLIKISRKNIFTAFAECVCIVFMCRIIQYAVAGDGICSALTAAGLSIVISCIVYLAILFITKSEWLSFISMKRFRK